MTKNHQGNWPWHEQIFDEVFACGSVCHLHFHYCMIGGNLTGTELLYIVYLKNSMKIMRVGRWERKSSRISILQLVQKDRAIKQRGTSRMPNFLSKQNRPVGLFRLAVCCQLTSDRSSGMNSEELWNLTLVWAEWGRGFEIRWHFQIYTCTHNDFNSSLQIELRLRETCFI